MKAFLLHRRVILISIPLLTLLFLMTSYQPSFSGAQTATFRGKIVSLKLGFWVPFANRPATLVIEDSKGRHHTVHTGAKTSYYPHRKPQYGDRVIVNCIRDEGVWAATTVTYR